MRRHQIRYPQAGAAPDRRRLGGLEVREAEGRHVALRDREPAEGVDDPRGLGRDQTQGVAELVFELDPKRIIFSAQYVVESHAVSVGRLSGQSRNVAVV